MILLEMILDPIIHLGTGREKQQNFYKTKRQEFRFNLCVCGHVQSGVSLITHTQDEELWTILEAKEITAFRKISGIVAFNENDAAQQIYSSPQLA